MLRQLNVADVGEEIADLNAALAILFELPIGALVELALALRLAAVLRQERLGVEGVDVADATGHEEEDDALGLSVFPGWNSDMIDPTLMQEG